MVFKPQKFLIVSLFVLSGLFAVSLSRTNAAIGDGLIGHWTLDAVTGAVVSDNSGNGNNGTITGGVASTTAGHINNAVSLDGSTGYISMGDLSSVENIGAITVSAWVKASVADGAGMVIVGKSKGTAPTQGWLLWRSGSNETYRFTVATSTQQIAETGTFRDTLWHHVVGVYDGSLVRIYVDGVNADSTPPAQTGLVPNVTSHLCIGGSAGSTGCSASTSSSYGGTIDDVRIYNRALGASEVAELYALAGEVTPPPADTTAPVRTNGAPSGALASGTTQASLTLTTDENSTCRYSTTANTAYGSIANTFSTTGGTSHSQTITGLTNGTSYNYYVRCADVLANANTNDFAITFSVNTPPADTTAPVRTNGAPSGALASGTTQTSLTLTTNEDASCRYSQSAGIPFDSMTGIFTSSSGGTSHSTAVTGLTNGTTYNYYVRCSDILGNKNSNDFTITFSVNTPPPADTTAPVRTNGAPTGPLAAGTTQATLSLTTNENATCRYSTTANTAYGSMSNTFSTTGGTSHSQTVAGLANGTAYNYYVRCADVLANANTNDFAITFSVNNTAPEIPAGSILNMTGWEMGTPDETTGNNGVTTIQTAVKRSGVYALRINPTGTGTGRHEFRKMSANGTPSTGFASNNFCATGYFKPDLLPVNGSEQFMILSASGSATKLEARVTSNGQVALYSATGAILGTSSAAVTPGTWNKISLGAGTGNPSVSGSPAAYELYINDVLALSGIGNVYNSQNDRMSLGKSTNHNGNSVDFYYDDWVFESNPCSSAVRPSAQIFRLLPNGNGTHSSWTAGAGVHSYLDVDEVIPDGSTTYVQSLASGTASTFNLQNAAAVGMPSGGNIVAVKPWVIFGEAGSDATLDLRTRTLGADFDLASFIFPASRALYSTIYQTSPATGVPWTFGEIDALEVGGREVTGSTNRGRMHTVGAMVAYQDHVSDTTAPVLTNVKPNSDLPFGSVQVKLSFSTDENASCRYSTSAGISYDNMTATFTTTGAMAHEVMATGLTNGTTYNYYVRCSDALGNKNTNDRIISFGVGAVGATPIIIDHTAIELFDHIPAFYINEVKKMYLNIPGESESTGYKNGLEYLSAQNPLFKASVTLSGIPEGSRSDALRASGASWGDVSDTVVSGWKYWYGEEDWFTSALAKERTKASLSYSNSIGRTISAFGFGWCTDMCNNANPDGVSGVDPVFHIPWIGRSEGGPEGNRGWGLTAADTAVSGNSINMDTYISATEEYSRYAQENNIDTKVFLTTGPLRSECSGLGPYAAEGYQTHIKHQYLRNYALSHPGSVLLDYADIEAYNNQGQLATQSYQVPGGPFVTYQTMHGDNMINFNGTDVAANETANDADGDHIGQVGALRLGKAQWVLMARLAGWDGQY